MCVCCRVYPSVSPTCVVKPVARRPLSVMKASHDTGRVAADVHTCCCCVRVHSMLLMLTLVWMSEKEVAGLQDFEHWHRPEFLFSFFLASAMGTRDQLHHTDTVPCPPPLSLPVTCASMSVARPVHLTHASG